METKVVTWLEASAFDAPLDCSWDGPTTLIMVFGGSTTTRDHPAVAYVFEHFPNSIIVGCSTAGQFAAEVADDDLRIVLCRFAYTEPLAVSTRIGCAEDSHAAGTRLAEQIVANANAPVTAVLVLSDGLRVNGTPLVDGMAAVLPGAAIFGGLAGDGVDFASTWVLARGVLAEGQIVAVGLCGERLRTRHGSGGGGTIFGPERAITRSLGNVLYELDGRPALALYKEYLGDLASGLPATALLFPLAVRIGDASHTIVRTVLSVNEAELSMTFAGDIPEGATAQLLRAAPDELIDAAADAVRACGEVHSTSDFLAFGVSCVARRLVLGERVDEELEVVAALLPPGTPFVGFYAYGEISPATGRCELHNQTMTITTLVEV